MNWTTGSRALYFHNDRDTTGRNHDGFSLRGFVLARHFLHAASRFPNSSLDTDSTRFVAATNRS
jgi:hypothetical protein